MALPGKRVAHVSSVKAFTMKKIPYLLLAAYLAMLPLSSCTEEEGTSAEALAGDEEANSQQDSQPRDTNRAALAPNLHVADPEQMYRAHADSVATQMAQDMQLDEVQTEEVARVFYDLSRQLHELDQEYNYSETNRMGGQADEGTESNEQAVRDSVQESPPQMSHIDLETERKRVNDAAEAELKSILTPEQYTRYRQHRTRYNELKFSNPAWHDRSKQRPAEQKGEPRKDN